MTDHSHHNIRFADLPAKRATAFELLPDAAARKELAAALGILALKKLRFAGEITPLNRQDWQLTASLGATCVQACVVTLDPVTTRIDEPVERRYLHDLPEISAGEAEMPEDDTQEPLPATLDLFAVMTEALSLALPAFPRAPDAELGQMLYSEAGIAPMTDQDTKPFAGLASLKQKLENKEQ